MANESLGTRVTLDGAGLYLLYGAVFLFLTLAVSAWAKNARTGADGVDRVLGVCRLYCPKGRG